MYRFIEENWNNPSTSGEKKFNEYKSVSVYGVDSSSDDELGVLKSMMTTTSSSKCLCENLCDSTFFATMKSSQWLLAECNRYSVQAKNVHRIDVITEIKAKKAADIFIKEQVFLQLYGLHVPYAVNAPFREKSSLSMDLGKRNTLNI